MSEAIELVEEFRKQSVRAEVKEEDKVHLKVIVYLQDHNRTWFKKEVVIAKEQLVEI